MRRFMKPLHDFIYPHCCICCGQSLENYEIYICDFCTLLRFETTDNKNLIVPESVLDVISLWKFDKGGYLQEILHQLKYNKIQGAGSHLGMLLGKKILEAFPEIGSEGILVPVPLHRSKERKRGFNQARSIAEGISNQINWPLIDENAIQRVKKTKTQTGLSSEQRALNLSKAFVVNIKKDLENHIPVIVDDVFTTGTTTFELVKAIHCETGIKCYVATAAEA